MLACCSSGAGHGGSGDLNICMFVMPERYGKHPRNQALVAHFGAKALSKPKHRSQGTRSHINQQYQEVVAVVGPAGDGKNRGVETASMRALAAASDFPAQDCYARDGQARISTFLAL